MPYGLRCPKRYPLQMIQISLRNDENGEYNDDSENNVDGETDAEKITRLGARPTSYSS